MAVNQADIEASAFAPGLVQPTPRLPRAAWAYSLKLGSGVRLDVSIEPDVVLPAGCSEHGQRLVVILDIGIIAAQLAVEFAGFDDAVPTKLVHDGADLVMLHG